MSRTFRKIPCDTFKAINNTGTKNMKIIKLLKLVAKRILWRIKEAHEPDEITTCKKTSGVTTYTKTQNTKVKAEDLDKYKENKLPCTASGVDGMLKTCSKTAVSIKVDDDAKQKKQYTEYIRSKQAKKYFKNLAARTVRRKNKEIEKDAKSKDCE